MSERDEEVTGPPPAADDVSDDSGGGDKSEGGGPKYALGDADERDEMQGAQVQQTLPP